jgi:LysR family transcriptional regulator, glycine cleavage system transcriptional activator
MLRLIMPIAAERLMRLPSLNALHAFEAAARHQSFAKAALELHVSQGAISRHVKVLEEQLGIQLFRRQPQGVELTAQGKTLLPELTASFARMAKAAQQVADADREIRVASQPTLATRWLVRRLAGFQENHPHIRVALSTMCDYGDFLRGGFDLGIIHCESERGRPDEVDSFLFRQEAMAPVCAPKLISGPKPLRDPGDLIHHVLLHPCDSKVDWLRWLRVAGVEHVDAGSGLAFTTLEMAISAAIGELGVAMVDLRLIQDEVRSGRLVAPFDIVMREETGYFLITQRGRFREPKITAFRDWLTAEANVDEVS